MTSNTPGERPSARAEARRLAILYLGTDSGTCLDRACAYRRLGHRVDHVDLRRLLPSSAWIERLTWRAGGQWFAPWIRRALAPQLAGRRWDLCHVDAGEWVTGATIGLLRRHAPIVLNYNIDDPLGPRDGQLFAAYRRALSHYDLVAVVREENVPEARARGARRVLRVWRSADEVSHRPRALNTAERAAWASEVLFLGTWMPERGPFLAALIERGVPLSIRGTRWQKAPEWPRLAAHWRGPGVQGDDYAMAIQGARINLGLLSKGNRDLHTTRSMEIPALGAFLCAERTSEHRALYEEGVQAAFWADADECAAVCRRYLDDEPARLAVAAAGQRRLHELELLNERVLAELLGAVGLGAPAVQGAAARRPGGYPAAAAFRDLRVPRCGVQPARGPA